MLLLIDASRANNEQKTGVEWYAYFVIKELMKIIPVNIQVILFTREKLRGDLNSLPSNWQENILSWPPRRLWTQIRLSWEMLKYKKNKEAVLFVPAHVLPLVVPNRTFTTIHDLGGFSFPAGYSWFEKWYTKFAIKIAVKKANIFVPSNFIKKEIEYFFGGVEVAKKIKVVNNGYDKESFKEIFDKEKIKSILEKYKIQAPYFLSISRLEEKKNTVGIVQSFEIFKNKNLHKQHSLVLLGKPGFGFKEVEKTIEGSPYKNNIVVPGWVETPDVPYLMAGAAAFVYPSFYEGFGIPVLEAFAAGVPVVTSSLASLPEITQDAAFLVNPYKPQEIANALEEISNNEELRQEMIKKGKISSEKFSWEKTAKEIWENMAKEANL